jgi:hypothetical protein
MSICKLISLHFTMKCFVSIIIECYLSALATFLVVIYEGKFMSHTCIMSVYQSPLMNIKWLSSMFHLCVLSNDPLNQRSVYFITIIKT